MKTLFAALLLVASACQGQTMYRCGNAFSQQPCSPDAKAINVPGVPKPLPTVIQVLPDPVRAEAMKKECVRWATTVLQWKDRDSLRIGTPTVGELRIATVFNVRQVVRGYYVPINAKNSYGAYSGEKIVSCAADEHDTKILNVYEP